jgi:hypothetical protein
VTIGRARIAPKARPGIWGQKLSNFGAEL